MVDFMERLDGERRCFIAFNIADEIQMETIWGHMCENVSKCLTPSTKKLSLLRGETGDGIIMVLAVGRVGTSTLAATLPYGMH